MLFLGSLRYQCELSSTKAFCMLVLRFIYTLCYRKGPSFYFAASHNAQLVRVCVKLPNIDPRVELFVQKIGTGFHLFLFWVTSLSISIIPSVISFCLCIHILLRRMQPTKVWAHKIPSTIMFVHMHANIICAFKFNGNENKL